MHAAFRIDPDAVYDDGAVVLSLDISSATLVRARRDGALRYRRVGRRAVYLGRWLIEWLDTPQTAASPAVRARNAN
jgi:hypothetical protein